MAAAQSELPLELYNELKAIVEMYEGEAEGSDNVVTLKDDIIRACKQHKCCRAATLHVKQIGPHPSNRDGEGLAAERAQTRLKVIKKGGCSLATLRPNCVAIEDNPTTRSVAKFTMEVCSMSEQFARYSLDEVKAGTLGAGHATHGFAQLHDEVPCTIPEISEDGKMSKKKCYSDKHIKACVENGIEYDLIDWRVERAFPIIPHIIQSALNVVQQVSEGESWHQIMMKIANEAKTQFPNIKYDQIKKSVLKTQPPRPHDVPDMVEYVAKWGGLPSGMFIKELSELCSVFVSSDRVVSHTTFGSLANMKFPIDAMPADLINSIVFVLAKSNVGICDGIAKYLKPSDYTDMLNPKNTEKYDRCQLANTILQRARLMLAENPMIPKHRRLHMSAQLKEACVEAALLPSARKEERTLEIIAKDFAAEISSAIRGESTTCDAPPSTVDFGVAKNVITYEVDGSTAAIGSAIVAQRGFEVGQYVQIKDKTTTMKAQYMIKTIRHDGAVELARVDTVEATVVHDSLVIIDRDQFLNQYTKAAQVIEVKEGYPKFDPSNCNDLADIADKGRVVDALLQLSNTYAAPNVRVFKWPNNRVVALESFKAGSFIAVPATISVLPIAKGADTPTMIIARMSDPEKQFMLKPYETSSFIAPAWSLIAGAVSDESAANCMFSLKEAHGKPMSTAHRNKHAECVVIVPCIVNMKPIGKFDEIVMYRPSAPKAAAAKRESTMVVDTGLRSHKAAKM
jgi:hypothetical protein